MSPLGLKLPLLVSPLFASYFSLSILLSQACFPKDEVGFFGDFLLNSSNNNDIVIESKLSLVTRHKLNQIFPRIQHHTEKQSSLFFLINHHTYSQQLICQRVELILVLMNRSLILPYSNCIASSLEKFCSLRTYPHAPQSLSCCIHSLYNR